MEPNQIILLVMIAIGIIFIIASIVLSVREKNSDPKISAQKQELKDEMDQMYVERARTEQKQLDDSTKQALDEYVEEAKRELEVLMNEAKEYVEQLSAIAQSQMESCVTQTQEETNSIAEEMKARLQEISAAEDEKIQQSFADVREEIAEHQKEASMAYTMISEKQNQLIGSIEHEQSRTKELAETVAQISADASFLQEELLPAAREAVPEIEKTQPETEVSKETDTEIEMTADTGSAVAEAEKQDITESADMESTETEEFMEAAEVEMTEAAEAEVSKSAEAGTETTEAAEAEDTAEAEMTETEEEQLQAERDFAETMEFDVVQLKQKGDGSANLDLTKPIDRGEIREALQAQGSQPADTVSNENRQTEKNAKAAENAMPVSEEIDIDEVVVADVEEFDSIATETVKAAVQEVLDEEESLLDYSETEWDTESVMKETAEAEKTDAKEPAETNEKPHGKKTSVVWKLAQKEKVPEPEEETIPEDMVLEDEPNKMLHAVRSSGTVSTEADLEMRKKVLNMYDRGSSSMEIAEKLGLGIGEVRMIIDLYSRRER